MNYVRFFVGCCVLAVLPHASQAQRYYSDDGQYAADVEHIEQSPSQFHKGGVTFAILFYVHRTSDTTPPNKVSPLRSDQLICATIDGITAEGGEVPAFSYSDPDGVSVIGQNSTAICGNEIGSVRKRLEALDFRIYIGPLAEAPEIANLWLEGEAPSVFQTRDASSLSRDASGRRSAQGP